MNRIDHLFRMLRGEDSTALMPFLVAGDPTLAHTRDLICAVEQAGAHAVSLINTLTGMAVDIDTRTPRLANLSGGLSGPAIRPVALYLVHRVVRAVEIPVVGIGGIMDHRDALEFLIAGACAVQVGTANFVNPRAPLDILTGLERYCREKGIAHIEEIVGTLRSTLE